jgi:hypothetical protein
MTLLRLNPLPDNCDSSSNFWIYIVIAFGDGPGGLPVFDLQRVIHCMTETGPPLRVAEENIPNHRKPG